jgi:hypothetical protein
VKALTTDGVSAPAIAERLQAEGYRPARHSARLGLAQVTELQRRLGLRPCRPRIRGRAAVGPPEWWASDLADRLGLSRSSMQRWIRLGWVRARHEDGRLQRWIVWADEAELARLTQLQQRCVAEKARRHWTQTPAGPQMTTATLMTRAHSGLDGGV